MEKEEKDFYNSKSRKDGKHPYCNTCQNEMAAARYKNNPEARRQAKERSRLFYLSHKDEHITYIRERRKRLKLEIIEGYGGKCFCCGEKNIIFLTIDHIHDNGAEERRKLKLRGAGVWFYEWIKKNGWPKDYQVACFNCNIGRYLNGGKCPHKGTKES
jgi:hypothetical protein